MVSINIDSKPNIQNLQNLQINITYETNKICRFIKLTKVKKKLSKPIYRIEQINSNSNTFNNNNDK